MGARGVDTTTKASSSKRVGQEQSQRQERYRPRSERKRPTNTTTSENRPATSEKRRGMNAESSNVVFVRADRESSFYIYLAKKLFSSGTFEDVEFHAAGERCIYILIKAIEVLQRYGYATADRIKTKTLTSETTRAKVSKLIVTIRKTAEFERLHQEFEAVKQSKRDSKPKEEATAKITSPKIITTTITTTTTEAKDSPVEEPLRSISSPSEKEANPATEQEEEVLTGEKANAFISNICGNDEGSDEQDAGVEEHDGAVVYM
jgi:hypothetical protein